MLNGVSGVTSLDNLPEVPAVPHVVGWLGVAAHGKTSGLIRRRMEDLYRGHSVVHGFHIVFLFQTLMSSPGASARSLPIMKLWLGTHIRSACVIQFSLRRLMPIDT